MNSNFQSCAGRIYRPLDAPRIARRPPVYRCARRCSVDKRFARLILRRFSAYCLQTIRNRTYSPPSPLRCATIFRARAEPRRYKVLAALGVTAPRTGSPPLRGKGQNSESSSRKSTTPMFNTPFSSYQRFLMSCRTTILGKESPINPKGLVSASILLSFSIA